MATPEPSTTGNPASELVGILDAYLADLHAGKAPERAALLAAHPHLAAQLESCLAALDFIHTTERPDPTMPPALGDFHVVREIGRGAMGVVYEAEQLSLKRRVALKVLRFGGAADPEAMERFQREAETVARLHHTNIVPIFAVGCASGVHYFAMQLIAGRSLAGVLEDAKSKSQPLDAKTVAGWGVQSAEALAHAHARGVVHRDVKPSNLLLDGEGVVWLTDFGLARRSDETAMTLAGVLLGTPRYMSPEQASAVQKPVDERSDVYSLGATLYELATGRPVFEAQTATELLRQIAETEPESPRQVRRDLPRDLETVLLKCLAKEPSQRYATAQDLADDLRRVVSGDPVKARRPNVLMRLRRWGAKQSRGSLVIAGVVVATIVVLAGLVLGIEAYREGQKGQLQITTDGTILQAEILTRDGEPVLPPFYIPREDAISLPGGWYRVRVSTPGTLSADYEVLVEPGQHRSVALTPGHREAGPPLPIMVKNGKQHFQIVTLRCQDDILLTTEVGDREDRRHCKIKLIEGLTHRTLWEQSCQGAFPVGYTDGRSFKELADGGSPGLVQPAPDLDGDGVGDLLWAGQNKMLGPAISGKDGRVLWSVDTLDRVAFAPGQRLLLGSVGGPGAVVAAGPKLGRLVCPPILANVDCDEHPDVISLFATVKRLREKYVVRACVVAVKGNTGEQLWHYDFSPTETNSDWPGEVAWLDDFAAIITRTDNRPTVLIRVDQQFVILDLRTGRLEGVIGSVPDQKATGKWQTCPDRRCLLIFSAGDTVSCRSTSDLSHVWAPTADESIKAGCHYLPRRRFMTANDILFDFDDSQRFAFSRFDIGSGEVRWRNSLARGPILDWWTGLAWAFVPKLNDHPCGCFLTAALIPGASYGHSPDSVYLLTAANKRTTGEIIGQRLQPLAGKPPPVFSDGKGNYGQDVKINRFEGLVRWLPAGTSQPPFLAVNYRDHGPDPNRTLSSNTPSTYLYGANGQLRHVWPEVVALGTANFAGDGMPYLYGAQRATTDSFSLHIAPLGPREIWRRPGCWRTHDGKPRLVDPYPLEYICPPLPDGDLNGDGIPDVLFHTIERSKGEQRRCLHAVSGKDGHRLWRSENPVLIEDHSDLHRSDRHPRILHCVDLHRNGYPDVLCANDLKIILRDGRNGQPIWQHELKGGSINLSPLFNFSGKGGWAFKDRVFTADVNGVRAVIVVDGDDPLRGYVFEGKKGNPIPEPLPALPEGQRLTLEKAVGGLRPQSKLIEDENKKGRRVWKSVIEWKDQNGRVVWRCEGPGIDAGTLPSTAEGKPPVALFIVETSGQPYTVCLEAFPAGDTPPVLDFGPTGTDPLRMSLPWAYLGKQQATRSSWFALIAVGLVLFCAFRRQPTALGLAGWLLCFPMFVGVVILPRAAGGRYGIIELWETVGSKGVFLFGVIGWYWVVAACRKKNLRWRVASLLGVPILFAGLLTLVVLLYLADEPFDWSDWYLVWPYSFSALDGWSLFANPLTWIALWLLWRTLMLLGFRWKFLLPPVKAVRSWR